MCIWGVLVLPIGHKSTDVSKTILCRDFVLAARYTQSILRSFTVAFNFILTLTFTAKGHIYIYCFLCFSHLKHLSQNQFNINSLGALKNLIVIMHQMSALDKCARYVHQMSASDECFRWVLQMSAPDECTRWVRQMSAPSSINCHRPTTIAQLSSSPKYHPRPIIIIAQLSSSPECLHSPRVIIAQQSSSPKCHHLPNIIAQMSSSP